jgi:hypothetical protein
VVPFLPISLRVVGAAVLEPLGLVSGLCQFPFGFGFLSLQLFNGLVHKINLLKNKNDRSPKDFR